MLWGAVEVTTVYNHGYKLQQIGKKMGPCIYGEILYKNQSLSTSFTTAPEVEGPVIEL